MKRKTKVLKELTIADFIKPEDFIDLEKDVLNATVASVPEELIGTVSAAGKSAFEIVSLTSQYFLYSKMKNTNDAQINSIAWSIRKACLRVINSVFQVYIYFGGDIQNYEYALSVKLAEDLIEYLRFQVDVSDLEQAYFTLVELEGKKKNYTWASLTDLERKVAIIRYYFGVTTIDELWKVVYEL